MTCYDCCCCSMNSVLIPWYSPLIILPDTDSRFGRALRCYDACDVFYLIAVTGQHSTPIVGDRCCSPVPHCRCDLRFVGVTTVDVVVTIT